MVLSADMKDPTEPWGQPVPPYAMELIVTPLGAGVEGVVGAEIGCAGSVTPSTGFGAARTPAAVKARTDRMASILTIEVVVVVLRGVGLGFAGEVYGNDLDQNLEGLMELYTCRSQASAWSPEVELRTIETRVDIGFQAVEFAILASVYHCDGNLALLPRLVGTTGREACPASI